MRDSRSTSARIGLATAGLALALAVGGMVPRAMAVTDSVNDGKGFAGLLRMFNIFTSEHADKPAAAPVPAEPTVGKPALKVRASSNGAGKSNIGIEIPLDDPTSVAKGDGAFIYLESATDVVDGADLGHRVPQVGDTSPVATANSLTTRTAALANPGLGNLSVANPLAERPRAGSVWSFTPRYAAVRFGLSYLPDGSHGLDHKGFELGVTSSLLKTDNSIGQGSALDGAFLNSPLLGGGRRIYNLGFRLGYSGVSLGASLQRDEADLVGVQTAYDVGLQYRRGSFTTNLQFSSASNQGNRNLLFRVNPSDHVYAFEFGAAYRLRPGISLGGSLQYFNFNSVTLGPETDEAAQVFLGGNVNF